MTERNQISVPVSHSSGVRLTIEDDVVQRGIEELLARVRELGPVRFIQPPLPSAELAESAYLTVNEIPIRFVQQYVMRPMSEPFDPGFRVRLDVFYEGESPSTS